MVVRRFSKPKTRVRFPLPAPNGLILRHLEASLQRFFKTDFEPPPASVCFQGATHAGAPTHSSPRRPKGGGRRICTPEKPIARTEKR